MQCFFVVVVYPELDVSYWFWCGFVNPPNRVQLCHL